jgi:glyoxylase-like metal-dependent hydrolase (beta-lactamase superfamily II)
MSNIPFIRDFDFKHGRCDQLSPLIRRVIAANAGAFTYTGTGVYIIGQGDIAIIDPGPVLDGHIQALEEAIGDENVTHIFVTHHHLDHSPLAHPLAKKYGCKVYAISPSDQATDTGGVRVEAGDDINFKADVEITDLDIFKRPGWTLQALHTPGHTSNHVCYALLEENTLFCGDHIMGWSTSIVSPPDGSMGDYITQLKRIQDMKFDTLWPTHGPAIQDATTFIQAYIDHRDAREAQVLAYLKQGPSNIRDMVANLYANVDARLHPAAAHSILAQLIYLIEKNMISCDGKPELNKTYKLMTVQA